MSDTDAQLRRDARILLATLTLIGSLVGAGLYAAGWWA